MKTVHYEIEYKKFSGRVVTLEYSDQYSLGGVKQFETLKEAKLELENRFDSATKAWIVKVTTKREIHA